MTAFDPSLLTDEQLRQELLTSDYHGVAVKRLALDELISRAERQITLRDLDLEDDSC